MVENCVFCGAKADVPIVFPDTFTAYQFLQAGNSACKCCADMFGDAKYRRNCWYMQGNEWVKIEDPLVFLTVTLPAVPLPIIMYLTLKKRKHGWILSVQNPVLNFSRFILVVDEDKIFFDRQKFVEYLQFLGILWERGVPKGVLLSGYPAAGLVRKFRFSRGECRRLEQLQSDRLWQLVVAFKKREKEEDEKEHEQKRVK